MDKFNLILRVPDGVTLLTYTLFIFMLGAYFLALQVANESWLEVFRLFLLTAQERESGIICKDKMALYIKGAAKIFKYWFISFWMFRTLSYDCGRMKCIWDTFCLITDGIPRCKWHAFIDNPFLSIVRFIQCVCIAWSVWILGKRRNGG